jgi:hypothetical protein
MVSDEAFTCLLLENQYNQWKDIFDRKKHYAVTPRSEKRKRKWESDVSHK